ncbi:MAG: metal-dependent transcriptional regulator [Candidatus Latescibacteria bacterium]|jgi:DtxR family Mn-dependent transcriptional regulator|nr:metal-dependent transcriptional regulator [Candidatus Latescibacterota bacterium]MDP7448997.1 metal-dependent transcriptional regulator [Candidatus Latescibacterota bacterium]HJP34066.1 metal-dependent transcriptional regulator [Candidatus Latescibacterota bacterium]
MLSEAVQDYLKSIYKLGRSPEVETMVSTTLIAERMGVSAASATNMIKKLAEMRLLEHRPYQGVVLTPAGVKIALEIVRHHRLLELYLRQALGYDWDAVDAEADRLEHAISEDFEDRIDEALGYPTVGAHGEPIPTKDGSIAEPEYARLSELSEGQRACIRQVSDRDPELLRYLDKSGLVLGTEVRVAEKAPFRGPLRLDIDAGGEQHIGLDAAEAIYVDVIEK